MRDALDNINKYLYLHARGARIRQIPRGDSVQLQLIIEISSARNSCVINMIPVVYFTNI